jgi:stage II sporulation protein D
MLSRLLIVIFLLTAVLPRAQDSLYIGIFRDAKVTSAYLEAYEHDYTIVGDTSSSFSLQQWGKLELYVKNQKVCFSPRADTFCCFDSLKILAAHPQSVFAVDIKNNKALGRKYRGHLLATVEEDVHIRLVNHVHIDDYLVGVVESESGYGQNVEYYKVQAIISRTYALKNINKHLHEGFNLNDLVTCQVYHGKYRNIPNIIAGVYATSGMVLVDENMQLITASYYSNSGGYTANSEDVWNLALPYLRAKYDPYSIGQNSYSWKKTIAKQEFLSELEKRFKFPVHKPEAVEKALNFKQPSRRTFFIDRSYGIPLTEIRHTFKLRSTYFDVIDAGANVILQGKGFGHGVGLSQEGAMNMSKKGFNHLQILHFYYPFTTLLDADLLQFFNWQTAVIFQEPQEDED